MEMESLKVRMLGTFALEYQGKIISVERNSCTKTNQLLQLLLYNKEGVAREQLIYELFHNEQVKDPSNSLRALVFRLRKAFAEQQIPGDEYVVLSKRIYKFVLDCPIECDVHEFEMVADSAMQEEDEEKRYELLQKACDLYTGEFLPDLGVVDWAVVLNVKCRKLYFSCVEELCEECTKRKEYQKLLDIATKAATMYAFDGWQSYQMEALIAQNRSKEAILLYEKTEKMMFEELGVALPERMVQQMKSLGKQVKHRTDMMSEVLANVEEQAELEGAYESTFPNFVESYRLVSRMIIRSGQSAWLQLWTITDGKGYALQPGKRLEQLQQELHDVLKITLRKGDMFTQYSDNQYLVLLMEVQQEDCERVAERVFENIGKRPQKKYLQYQIAPVNGSRRV